MPKEYLKLPIRFSPLYEGSALATCDIKASIYRNLHLIITTGNGENKADEKFGVSFWDNDYDIHLSNDSRKEIIVDDLKRHIQFYEKRISNVDVQVNVRQAYLPHAKQEGMRRRVEITVTGVIKRSLEPIAFQTGFFIGPFTLG